MSCAESSYVSTWIPAGLLLLSSFPPSNVRFVVPISNEIREMLRVEGRMGSLKESDKVSRLRSS